jgi:hypothetical protein
MDIWLMILEQHRKEMKATRLYAILIILIGAGMPREALDIEDHKIIP